MKKILVQVDSGSIANGFNIITAYDAGIKVTGSLEAGRMNSKILQKTLLS